MSMRKPWNLIKLSFMQKKNKESFFFLFENCWNKAIEASEGGRIDEKYERIAKTAWIFLRRLYTFHRNCLFFAKSIKHSKKEAKMKWSLCMCVCVPTDNNFFSFLYLCLYFKTVFFASLPFTLSYSFLISIFYECMAHTHTQTYNYVCICMRELKRC